MGKFCENVNVQNFSPTDPVLHDTFLNEFQNQLRGMLKARYIEVNGLFVPEATGSWGVTYTPGGPGNLEWCWETGANPNGERCVAFLPLRTGEKITNVNILYYDTSRNGGEMALYKRQHLPVGDNQAGNLNAGSKIIDIGKTASNPWNQGGANYWHIKTAATEVVQDYWQYYISIQSSTVGSAATDRFWYVGVEVQFGN